MDLATTTVPRLPMFWRLVGLHNVQHSKKQFPDFLRAYQTPYVEVVLLYLFFHPFYKSLNIRNQSYNGSSYWPDNLVQSLGFPPELNGKWKIKWTLKEVLYEVGCLKSNEDMILALAGQFKRLSYEPEKFRWLNVESPEFFRFIRQLLKLSSKCEVHIFIKWTLADWIERHFAFFELNAGGKD